MVLHNPNNWHWVNKDVSEWTRQWFTDNLTKVQAEQGDVSAKINAVQTMEGDVDVSQRKGKVITIFDVKLVLEFSGSAPDAPDVTGTIRVPEVAHDTDEDEYVFDVDLFAESTEKQPVKDLVKSKILPELRQVFQKLAPTLMEVHGKELQHAAGVDPSSNITPARTLPQKGSEATHIGSGSSTSQQGPSGAVVNTTTVTDQQEFRTTAEEAYKTFVDPQRIAAFTRAPPKLFEGAHKGGRFELFDGNVAGEYVELDEPKRLVQKWRLKQWPAGHYSTLRIDFDQNDVDHVTLMRVTWNGVPVGQEDITKRNWSEYYIRSIKQTFGFGTIL